MYCNCRGDRSILHFTLSWRYERIRLSKSSRVGFLTWWNLCRTSWSWIDVKYLYIMWLIYCRSLQFGLITYFAQLGGPYHRVPGIHYPGCSLLCRHCVYVWTHTFLSIRVWLFCSIIQLCITFVCKTQRYSKIASFAGFIMDFCTTGKGWAAVT